MTMTTRTTIRWPQCEQARVCRYADEHKLTLSAAIRQLLDQHIASCGDTTSNSGNED